MLIDRLWILGIVCLPGFIIYRLLDFRPVIRFSSFSRKFERIHPLQLVVSGEMAPYLV